jgi:hypothetical protein
MYDQKSTFIIFYRCDSKPFQPFLTFVTTTVVIIFALGYLIDFVAIKGENTIKIEIAGKSFLMKIYLTLFSAQKCRKLSQFKNLQASVSELI